MLQELAVRWRMEQEKVPPKMHRPTRGPVGRLGNSLDSYSSFFIIYFKHSII